MVRQNGEKRLRGVQLPFALVTGNVAFFLGKKATDEETHRWTVYVRSPTGEDISHVIKKVTFELHHSFSNPNREVLHPPFELTETGWGEFDIVIKLHFHDDAQEPPLELYHHLLLGLDEKPTQQRKPSKIHEAYEEIVFWEPTEAFYDRVKAHVPQLAPPTQLGQYFGKFDTAADYARVQAARRKLAPLTAVFKAKIAELEAQENAATNTVF